MSIFGFLFSSLLVDFMKKDLIQVDEENQVHMWLYMMHFVDQEGIHIVYSPALEMHDYGNSFEEAKAAFKESLTLWLEYVGHVETFKQELQIKGWTTPDRSTYYPPEYDVQEIIKEYDIEAFDSFELKYTV